MTKRFRLSNAEIRDLLGAPEIEFPKYSTQLLNLANQNAQGTRPAVVGQMTELIQEFSGRSIAEWERWYLQKHPEAIGRASKKVADMIDRLRTAMDQIDEEMIRNWVKDLVIIKTFIGLRLQEAILCKASDILGTKYRLATPEEESRGIDGFIGERPVSIKPETYRSKKSLPEEIAVTFLYYKKTTGGITVDLGEFAET